MNLIALFIYSFTSISLSSEFTDNLRLLKEKDEGNIFTVTGYFQENNFFNIENETNLYIINFDENLMILGDFLHISKTFHFKNLGNKNKTFSEFEISYPPDYEIYRYLKFKIGNNLDLYLKNKYLLSITPLYSQKIYFTDLNQCPFSF